MYAPVECRNRPSAGVVACVAILGALMAASGCTSVSENTAAAPAGSIELHGAGSTFAAPLVERWASSYRAQHPNVAVLYDAVGSGEGIRRFLGQLDAPEDEIDFSMSDAPLSDAQLATVPGAGFMIPGTAGCVVLAHRVPGVHKLRLSRRAYVDIFLGKLQKWNDPEIGATNPGVALPDLAIGRAVRQDGSGTTFALSSHLAAVSAEWRGLGPVGTQVSAWPGTGVVRGKGNEGVAGLVRNFEGMIGYVGYEFARKLDLDIASLENRQGWFAEPSVESCAAALESVETTAAVRGAPADPTGETSYPIVALSWVLLRATHGNTARDVALRDFIEWCLKDGQAGISELGYVRLPQKLADFGLAALALDRSRSVPQTVNR